jgi:hypothetical protein
MVGLLSCLGLTCSHDCRGEPQAGHETEFALALVNKVSLTQSGG